LSVCEGGADFVYRRIQQPLTFLLMN